MPFGPASRLRWGHGRLPAGPLFGIPLSLRFGRHETIRGLVPQQIRAKNVLSPWADEDHPLPAVMLGLVGFRVRSAATIRPWCPRREGARYKLPPAGNRSAVGSAPYRPRSVAGGATSRRLWLPSTGRTGAVSRASVRPICTQLSTVASRLVNLDRQQLLGNRTYFEHPSNSVNLLVDVLAGVTGFNEPYLKGLECQWTKIDCLSMAVQSVEQLDRCANINHRFCAGSPFLT